MFGSAAKNNFAQACLAPLLVIGGCILLKLHFAGAGAAELDWLLKPVSLLVSLLAGLDFVHLPGEGYYNAGRQVLIAPACAGLNFFIILLAAGGCLAAPSGRAVRLPARLAGTALLAYTVALLVNALRILLALARLQIDLSSVPLDPEQLHRLEGIIVYYVCLCLYVMLVWRIWSKPGWGRAADLIGRAAGWRMFLPLGCYLLFTLGLPLANGAWRKDPAAFVRHGLTVLLVSGGLTLLFVWAGRRVAARRRSRQFTALENKFA